MQACRPTTGQAQLGGCQVTYHFFKVHSPLPNETSIYLQK